jgi:eukaryotic-like serine/threonine-protein kinase
MTHDRLSDVLRISRDALEREGAARAAYLDSACGDDRDLRREVEALLADRSAGSHGLLDTPPWAPPSLDPGQHLGPYEVIRLLGTGGMGAVFQAEDTRLKRAVALKVLSGVSALDPAARERFTREARAIAALDHPHICALYDIGRDVPTVPVGRRPASPKPSGEGEAGPRAVPIDYLVMEYLEGETLAKRLAPPNGAARAKPLPFDEALAIGVQIADALAAAHKQGIVHRDLKPGNVMLTTTGAVRPGAPQVKLLDFGLAKLKRPALGAELGVSAASTAAPATTPGAVMGTVPYMAPEQLEGKEVDARADLFSFGCVLYEMLTGRRAFPGETSASVISAIMTAQPPPVSTLVPVTPPALEHLVTRCLAKNADERWQTARDVADELRWVQESGGAGRGKARRRNDSHRRPAWWKIAIPAAALVAIAAAAYLLHERSQPILTERDVVVLADFINTTGDTVWNGTLKQALGISLGQSPFLSIYPDEGVRETLTRMARSPDATVTGAVAREVGQREGLKAAVEGSIAALGSRYLIMVEVRDCRTGASLVSEKEEAESKEAVSTALDRLAVRIRRRLGESLTSVEKYDAPLERATTPSLEALQAYSLGVRESFSGNTSKAVTYLSRAIELDPTFASAYSRLANRYEVAGDSTRAEECARKAYALRDRATENERYYITSTYHLRVDGDLIKEVEVTELWKRAYPRNSVAANHLGGALAELGRLDEAAEQYRQVVSANRADPSAIANLAASLIALRRLAEAKALCEESLHEYPDSAGIHRALYLVALLQGDDGGARAQREWARGKPREPAFIEVDRQRAVHYGQFGRSRKLRLEAAALTGRQPPTGSGIAPITQAWVGNLDTAHEGALAALEAAKGNRAAAAEAALALALTGDGARAEPVAADLGSRFPVDTLLQARSIPVIRAGIELTRKNPQKAIQLLNRATAYDRGELTSLYLRGLAWLQAGSAADAAAEFQKVIERGDAARSVLYPLSYLGRARALALGGDVAASRKGYEDFLTLWKDADADIPILKEAKAEYAKLRSVSSRPRGVRRPDARASKPWALSLPRTPSARSAR